MVMGSEVDVRSLISPERREWARAALRKVARPDRTRSRRKLLLVHLDGVPKPLLEEGMAQGRMPFLSRLVGSGAYRFQSAFWGSPASTPAFQAGLLLGNRHPNLPGYLWFDRALKREVRMNLPTDTLAMERRLGDTHSSLLAGGGTAYSSLFEAGSANRIAMSSLAELGDSGRRLLRDMDEIPAFVRKSRFLQLCLFLGGSARKGCEVLRWIGRKRDLRHERQFLQNRLLLDLLWSFACKRVLVDMARGVPVIYLVFGIYDEISHRRGPRSEESSRELWRVDAALADLFAVAQAADRPYDVVLLTDHGHVASDPFERRAGRPLRRALEGCAPVPLRPETRALLLDGRARWEGGRNVLRAPIVVEAGNFAHLYFDGGTEPLEAKEILGRFPDVVARAANHEEIGLTALRRGSGAVALIGGCAYSADELHKAPLDPAFSREAVADLLRELPHMRTAGDLVLYGRPTSEIGTVGFAWEFGSHGGLTREETQSVLCWPRDLPVDLSELAHVTDLHRRLMGAYR